VREREGPGSGTLPAVRAAVRGEAGERDDLLALFDAAALLPVFLFFVMAIGSSFVTDNLLLNAGLAIGLPKKAREPGAILRAQE